MKKTILFLLIIMLFAGLYSQTLQDDMQNFANDSSKGYVRPLNSAFNSAMNASTFVRAKSLGFLKFEVILNTNFTIIPDDGKTFIAKRPDVDVAGIPLYEPDQTKTATIFGDRGSYFNVNGDLYNASDVDNINLPDGLNLNVMPFLSPQINLGLPVGFEIAMKYFPLSIVDNQKFKNSYFWGFGAKKYIKIPVLPVDFSVSAFLQGLNAEDVVKSTNFSTTIMIGKRLLNFDFYGALSYSHANLSVDYKTEIVQYQPPYFVSVPINIKFNLKENFIMPKIGVTYRLFLFDMNFEATLAKYPNYNFGLGIRI